jgi:nicotinamide-nucleotide amidase
VRCYRRQTVGDNFDRLVEALRLALSRADAVITIGGLGPTEDDLTRTAIAHVMGVGMRRDDGLVEGLRATFAMRGLPWFDAIARQADVPEGARAIPNEFGTAPGLICPLDGSKVILALPGPRGEFLPMVDGAVREYFAQHAHGEVMASRTLRVCGMGESQVESLLKDVMGSTNPTVAPYAKLGEVHLRVTASAANRDLALEAIRPIAETIRSRLGWHVFGEDETTLEAACLRLLGDRGQTLSVAESVTGGGLGARLTSIPGASRVFAGGAIVYTPGAKEAMLGVPASVLEAHGPVSESVAADMAGAARARLKTDFALAITGNAGPTADVDGKPVGLVFLALAGPAGVAVEKHQFRGLREDIRMRASQAALTMLYRELVAPNRFD